MNNIYSGLSTQYSGLKKRRMAVTALFFVLASLYSIITPIFEISDEMSHYPVIDYIADHGALPVQDVNRPNAWDWEAAQPPLYYVLSALIVAPFDRGDLAEHWRPNPHAKIGIGLATDNQNMALHDWEAQSFPWQGTPLHVHLIRFFSVLLGTWAVWMTFAVAKLAVPSQPSVALVAMCLTAFNPMFIAISGSVNNDNLVNALVPTGLVVALAMWREGFSWGRVWLLALIGTLAAASKVSGVILFVPAGLMIALTVWRDKLPYRKVIFAALIFVGVWGALFGWWYARNLRHYDDFFGNQHMAETVGLREERIGVIDLIREESNSFFYAYWGWFGGLNIIAPQNLFNYAGVLWIFGAAGCVLYVIKKRRTNRRDTEITENSEKKLGNDYFPLLILLVALLLALYGVISWTLITPASQGRLLFPFMAVISTFTALGLVTLFRSRIATLLTAPILMYAIVCLIFIIPRAFAITEKENMPDLAQPIGVRYGDAIELIGYQIDDEPIAPDGLLKVTLYWRAVAKTEQPLSLYVQVFAPDGLNSDQVVEVGKVDSYPGRGLLQTTLWETGVIYEDTYQIELKNIPDYALPFEPRLKIGWRDNATNADIAAVEVGTSPDILPTPIESVIVRGGRISGGSDNIQTEKDVVFGNAIRLNSSLVLLNEKNIFLTIGWEALVDIQEDFVVFVQLVAPGTTSPILASGDAAPRQTWWQTSDWIPSERFEDSYRIVLPADFPTGDYEILVGFYRPRPGDGSRLEINVPPYADSLVIPVTVE